MVGAFQHLKRWTFDRAYRRSFDYRVEAASGVAQQSAPIYLATATIVRDEAKFIREFVAFHKLVGVEHMLLYMDGGFDKPLADQIIDFVESGFVELIAWPRVDERRNNQFLAYKNAVERMRGQTTWLALIDADEFLFAPSSNDLCAELRKREDHAALAVYSHTFGTGGVSHIPAGGLVTEKLVKRGPVDHAKNRTQRTIVQPSEVAAIRSANTCVLRNTAYLGWDEDGKPVFATGEKGHNTSILRINHYFTRSEEDFRAKIARRYFGKTGHQEKMASKESEAADPSLSLEVDLALQHYVPKLRALMGRVSPKT